MPTHYQILRSLLVCFPLLFIHTLYNIADSSFPVIIVVVPYTIICIRVLPVMRRANHYPNILIIILYYIYKIISSFPISRNPWRQWIMHICNCQIIWDSASICFINFFECIAIIPLGSDFT